jgi:hypothetical protein
MWKPFTARSTDTTSVIPGTGEWSFLLRSSCTSLTNQLLVPDIPPDFPLFQHSQNTMAILPLPSVGSKRPRPIIAPIQRTSTLRHSPELSSAPYHSSFSPSSRASSFALITPSQSMMPVFNVGDPDLEERVKEEEAADGDKEMLTMDDTIERVEELGI